MTTFLSLSIFYLFLARFQHYTPKWNGKSIARYKKKKKKKKESRCDSIYGGGGFRTFSFLFLFFFSSRNWMTELCSNFLLLVNARQRIVRRVESIFKNYKKEKKRLLILFRLFLFDDVALEIRCSSNRWCFFWKHVGINIERDRLVEEYKNPGRIC